ncbi:hypothetical protein TWF506_002343 [Arthrobotrys conoides]|uniref:Uncharacterized protein n=1 Tax=Arthrobotrys conoides TaxID=74498 RepID=A0AAN8NCW3_9PEZI
MQISSLTVIVAALLFNLSLGSPITPRILEAREASAIASRRLEARDETAPPIASDCSTYKIKAAHAANKSELEIKKTESLCHRLCEVIKKNSKNSGNPSTKLFEVNLNKNCEVPKVALPAV